MRLRASVKNGMNSEDKAHQGVRQGFSVALLTNRLEDVEWGRTSISSKVHVGGGQFRLFFCLIIDRLWMLCMGYSFAMVE